MLLTRRRLRRRKGDADPLGDYATGSERAQPAGSAEQRRRSHRPPGRARACAPSAPAPPAQVRRPPAPPPGSSRPAHRSTPASLGPALIYLGRPGTCRGLDGGAEGQPAERPREAPQAWHPGWPRHATSTAPALRRKPRSQPGGGDRKTAERKEVPPGILSRERGRAASSAGGVRLRRVCEAAGRRALGRCGRRAVAASPGVEGDRGALGLQLGAAASAASRGRCGPCGLGRRQGLEGLGREVLPRACPAREALAAELRAARSWAAVVLGRRMAVRERAGVRGRPPRGQE